MGGPGTIEKVSALRILCDSLKVSAGQQRNDATNASSVVAHPLLELASHRSGRVRLFAFEALGLAAYGNEELPEKLSDAGDLQNTFVQVFEAVLQPYCSVIEQVVALCALSNLTSVSLALHLVVAESGIMQRLASLLKHRCLTIRCGAIEVMSQLAANPAQRLRVRSVVKWPELSLFLDEARRRGINTTFTFAAKLLRCNAGPQWGLPEMLELGFAVELDAALQAAIDRAPFPVGGDTRPLVRKLAAVVRRIAKRGLAHKLDVRSVMHKLVAAHQATLGDNADGAPEAKVKIRRSIEAALRALIKREQSWETYALEAAENEEVWRALRDEALDAQSSDEEEEEEEQEDEEVGVANGNDSEQLQPSLSQSHVMNLMSRELVPEDYELLLQLDDDTTYRRRNVADAEVVRLLPLVSHAEAAAFSSTQPRCTVCLVDFANGGTEDSIKVLPCGHLFHDDCISLWLTHSRNVCPLCWAPGVTQ